MKIITYKTQIAEPSPYNIVSTSKYIQQLKTNQQAIRDGSLGIYLARKIIIDDQQLYFLFIDVDGDRSLDEDGQIASAIFNLKHTLNVLRKLEAESYFQIIATGGTGFRLVSNLLVDKVTYLSFIDFIKADLSLIKDLNPTIDIEMPHQVFAYKGNKYQTTKDLVNRHSCVVEPVMFHDNNMTPDLYKEITCGQPLPGEIIDFLEAFFNFRPNDNLKSLGSFGKTIDEFRQIRSDLKINNFDISKLRKSRTSLSVDAVYEMIKDKYPCEIKQRKGRVISFQGYNCPACGRKTSNAWASPPAYTLKCFDVNCKADRAKGGLPLYIWAGIANEYNPIQDNKIGFNVHAPSNFDLIDDISAKIRNEIDANNDSLILITPGAGKTYMAVEHIAGFADKKLIVYSCLNKSLQEQAYKDILKKYPSASSNLYLLKPREDLCKRPVKVKKVASLGYSPAEMVCARCSDRKDCDYYKQRDIQKNGIYFITHAMLLFYEKIFKEPDLIVIDENIIGGFLKEEKCSEIDILKLSTVLKGRDVLLVNTIIDIARVLQKEQINENKKLPLFLDSRKILSKSNEDTIIDIISKQLDEMESDTISRIESVIYSLEKYKQADLFDKNINYNAINWIKGLVKKKRFSYELISSNGKISFNYKRLRHLNYDKSCIKVLDATGDKRIVESITGRKVNVLKSDINWKSRCVHIKNNTSRSVMKYAKDADLKRHLETALSKMSSKNILIVTYKDIEKRILNICDNICKELKLKKEFMGYHFQGPRGSNEYEKCDGVIVFGLPYPNINSAWQDAHILFPDEGDDFKDSWIYANMLWELVQNVHRTRPIRKPEGIDLVVIANHWPINFPEPDDIIDCTRQNNKVDVAIQQLEPLVKQFGFMNIDIAYIANISAKGNENIAKEFQNKINKLLNIQEVIYFYFCILCEDNQLRSDLNKKSHDHNLDIYILYNLIIVSKFSIMLMLQESINEIKTNNEYISELSKQQYTDIGNAFRDKYPHFEKFKIKTQNANGKYTNGVGIKEQVERFYSELDNLCVFKKSYVDSYETLELASSTIEPIRSGLLVVYIPDNYAGYVFTGQGAEFKTVSIMKGSLELQEFFEDVFGDIDIITNNGKQLAKALLLSEINMRSRIHDICLNEKVIRCGSVDFKLIDTQFCFTKYGLSDNPDMKMAVSQTCGVWEKQQELIQQHNLGNIIELENKIIWITAKMELTGIEIDKKGMQDYLGLIESEIAENKSIKKDYDDINRCLNGLNSDNRLRCNIKQLNTVTGRFEHPLLYVRKAGPVRTFFKARKGYKFIVADFSTQEPCIIGALSKDETLRKVFLDDKDIYVEIAQTVSRDDLQVNREIAKGIAQILHYGKRGDSILDVLEENNITATTKQALEIFETYHRKFSEFSAWRTNIVKEAREQKYMQTEKGRLLSVSDNTKDTTLYCFPIQGTASDGFKIALVDLHEQLQELDARIVLTVHDEIIVECRKDISDKVKVIVEECMTGAYKSILSGIEFKVDVDIRDTWAEEICESKNNAA